MNTGRMRHIIEFQRLQAIYNEEGFPTEENQYVTFQKAYADVNDLYGKEYWDSKQVISDNITVFHTRYFKNIDQNCTIFFRNQRYEIFEIDNIKYLNKELKIKAKLQVINSGN